MTGHILKTGCLPYDDESGFEVDIVIDPPSEYFDYTRIELNPDSEFTSFDIKKWPEVRAAINRAVSAHAALTADS